MTACARPISAKPDRRGLLSRPGGHRADRTMPFFFSVAVDQRERDVLRAVLQHQLAKGHQVFLAFNEGQEMVAGELPHFAGEA